MLVDVFNMDGQKVRSLEHFRSPNFHRFDAPGVCTADGKRSPGHT
jgi:hypothetical protein